MQLKAIPWKGRWYGMVPGPDSGFAGRISGRCKFILNHTVVNFPGIITGVFFVHSYLHMHTKKTETNCAPSPQRALTDKGLLCRTLVFLGGGKPKVQQSNPLSVKEVFVDCAHLFQHRQLHTRWILGISNQMPWCPQCQAGHFRWIAICVNFLTKSDPV
jgi:hypothetical protein